MERYQDKAALLLRLALAAGFLSSVASRLGFWGEQSSGWKNFVAYTGEVNSFAPAALIPFLAIVATILEASLGLLLLAGFMTRYAAIGSCVLTLLFASAMAYSSGVKSPLDYSVFAFSASALLLAAVPQHRWSVDEKLTTDWRYERKPTCEKQ